MEGASLNFSFDPETGVLVARLDSGHSSELFSFFGFPWNREMKEKDFKSALSTATDNAMKNHPGGIQETTIHVSLVDEIAKEFIKECKKGM